MALSRPPNSRPFKSRRDAPGGSFSCRLRFMPRSVLWLAPKQSTCPWPMAPPSGSWPNASPHTALPSRTKSSSPRANFHGECTSWSMAETAAGSRRAPKHRFMGSRPSMFFRRPPAADAIMDTSNAPPGLTGQTWGVSTTWISRCGNGISMPSSLSFRLIETQIRLRIRL